MHETTRTSLLMRVRDSTDQAAWRELECKYRELILRYCLRLGLQPADCDDVQQLVWLNLSRGIHNFEYDPRKGRFRDYLGRIVRNAVSRHFSRPDSAHRLLDTAVLAVIADEGSEAADAVWEREWVDHHYRMAMQTIRRTFEPQSVGVFEGLLAGQTVAALALSFQVSEQAVHKVKQRVQRRMQELIAQQLSRRKGPMNFDSRSTPPPKGTSNADDLRSDGFSLEGDSWIERLREAEAPPSLGAIGEYHLECEVGRGAQGVVHRAIQPGTNRRIAIKRLVTGSLADARTRARFDREIEACASLDHPNIVTVYGVDYVHGLPVLAMEWVDGLRVDEWSDRVGRDRPQIGGLVSVFLKTCEAIQHAHQRGVIHRDIKPSNILVTDRGDVRVLDFGLAKLTARGSPTALELTETGEFVGTPAYCSPEKLAGRSNISGVGCDVFSLGVVLYRMLAGRLPFAANRSVSDLLIEMESRVPTRPSAHNPAVHANSTRSAPVRLRPSRPAATPRSST